MKCQPGYYDSFISPITGKLRTYTQLPSLGEEKYIFIGDYQGNPIPSPALIDVRLDIIEIRTLVDQIKKAKFILQDASNVLSNSQALNQLVNGFLYTTNGVVSVQTPGSGSLALNEDYVYVGGPGNIAVGQPTINFDNLPNLDYKNLIIGDFLNRPEKKIILYLDNMANLSFKKVWRGDISGRPVESDALTQAEADITSALSNISNLASTVNSLVNTVNTLNTAVQEIESGLAAIGGFAAIAALFITVASLGGSLSALRSKVDNINLSGFVTGTIDNDGNIVTSRGTNCTLDVIPANAEVSFGNHKIVSLADPSNPQDGVNLRTLENAVSGAIADITLSGFVEGNSDSFGNIVATRGPTCTLDVIPAENNVSLSNYKLINLNSDQVEQKDALNANFLWDFIHDNVGVVWV